MWRDGFNTPINYNDHELFCGGAWYQNGMNGGKCGVCGDPWGKPDPEFEAGGKYAKGIITRTYTEGQEIGIAVEVTVQHGGWFEFRICPNNNFRTPITHECLNRNLLPLADGSGYRMYMGTNDPVGFKNVTLRLPNGLSCEQCVLQWKWHTGNSWGTDDDGRSCVGCGPQEEFYGCADVAIFPLPATSNTQAAGPTRRTPPPAGKTTQAPSDQPTTSSPPPNEERSTTQPPRRVPEVVTAAPTEPRVPENVTASTTEPRVTTPNAEGCVAADGYEDNKNMERWCQVNCPLGNCPPFLCRCGPHAPTRKVCKTTTVGPWKNANLDKWCARNCAAGFCPATHCMCEMVTAGVRNAE